MTEIEWTLPGQAAPQYGCDGEPRCDWLGDFPCPHHPRFSDELYRQRLADTAAAPREE